MNSPNQIKPKISNVAAAVEGRCRRWHDRGAATIRRLFFRLSRPVHDGMPAVWSSQMRQIAATAVFLTIFAAIFDPYFKPFSGPAPNFALQFLRDVTDSMKSGWYIIPAIIVVAIIGLMDWRDIRTASRRALLTAYGRAAFIFAAVSISGIAVNIIKQFVGRARPPMMEQFGVYAFSPFRFEHAFQSFPSGHAATAGALAVLLMLWHPRARWPLFAAMFVLACARIPAGAHYPSDVVAGFSTGVIITLAMARWLARRRSVFSFDGDDLLPRLNR